MNLINYTSIDLAKNIKTKLKNASKIEKTLKLDSNKLQRPVYFNKSLYIAKDNSIIRLN